MNTPTFVCMIPRSRLGNLWRNSGILLLSILTLPLLLSSIAVAASFGRIYLLMYLLECYLLPSVRFAWHICEDMNLDCRLHAGSAIAVGLGGSLSFWNRYTPHSLAFAFTWSFIIPDLRVWGILLEYTPRLIAHCYFLISVLSAFAA
jgi:hypothetical protein